jgi:hypothetical protein
VKMHRKALVAADLHASSISDQLEPCQLLSLRQQPLRSIQFA